MVVLIKTADVSLGVLVEVVEQLNGQRYRSCLFLVGRDKCSDVSVVGTVQSVLGSNDNVLNATGSTICATLARRSGLVGGGQSQRSSHEYGENKKRAHSE